jgi:phytoene dehydrogenase-like protein
VQTIAATTYEHWAKLGSRYNAEKDELGTMLWGRIAEHVPGLTGTLRVTDVATPLTFWNAARSWRGSFEGWMPTPDAAFSHLRKKVPELPGFYMAGQWMEPGGGIPPSIMSGRQAVQLLCADERQPFTPVFARPGAT